MWEACVDPRDACGIMPAALELQVLLLQLVLFTHGSCTTTLSHSRRGGKLGTKAKISHFRAQVAVFYINCTPVIHLRNRPFRVQHRVRTKDFILLSVDSVAILSWAMQSSAPQLLAFFLRRPFVTQAGRLSFLALPRLAGGGVVALEMQALVVVLGHLVGGAIRFGRASGTLLALLSASRAHARTPSGSCATPAIRPTSKFCRASSLHSALRKALAPCLSPFKAQEIGR